MTRIVGSNNQEKAFEEVVQLINQSRNQAYQAVDTLLIDLYWKVGKFISNKIALSEWGDGVIQHLAEYISKTHFGLKGFTRPNLFRMRQFYETYHNDTIVSPLVRQLP